MWKTLGDREGSGKGENAQARAKRLFADAAASVLARPEVSKMVTPMEKILIDRKLGVQAKKKGNPKYREMVSEALRAAEGSIKQLESTLDAVVDEYLDAADNEAVRGCGSRREEIGHLERNIAQLSERLDAAREGNGPLAGNMPAQAVARQKLRNNHRIKLFVLGNGSAGKTQICRRLNDQAFDPNIPSTHGIDLGKITLISANEDKPEIVAHVWDFGGQDIYHGWTACPS